MMVKGIVIALAFHFIGMMAYIAWLDTHGPCSTLDEWGLHSSECFSYKGAMGFWEAVLLTEAFKAGFRATEP